MFVRSSIRRNSAVAKLRRLSQVKKHYVTAARSAMTPRISPHEAKVANRPRTCLD
jgi:hypothetical protein